MRNPRPLTRAVDIFVAACRITGLDEVLQGPDHITVFAPTDEAFRQIPRDVRASLFRPAGRDALRRLICTHIAPGIVELDDRLAWMTPLSEIPVPLHSKSRRVGPAHVIARHTASNGVLYVVDRLVVERIRLA